MSLSPAAKSNCSRKTNYQSYASTAAPWMTTIIKTYGGNPYAHLVEMGKLAQKDGVIKGILLHQGESNTNDKEWPNKVKGIYDNLIKDLNLKAEEVPLLAGELVNADQKGACASMNTIIDELPKTIPNCVRHFFERLHRPSRPSAFHSGRLPGAGHAIWGEDAFVARLRGCRTQITCCRGIGHPSHNRAEDFHRLFPPHSSARRAAS